MDDERFDRWVRYLGGRATRRGVLAIVTASLAAIPFGETTSRRRGGSSQRNAANGDGAARQNADCAARCKDLFPPGKKRGRCISQGAHGRGPCAKPVCSVQCANDATCCDEPGFGCCADTCTEFDGDGACPPPVCVTPPTCINTDECCGSDVCRGCGAPIVCVEFKSLGTGACCTSDDQCLQSCVPIPGGSFGVCCDPAFPETCDCVDCPQ